MFILNDQMVLTTGILIGVLSFLIGAKLIVKNQKDISDKNDK